MVIVLIRTTLHPDCDHATYEALNAEMYQIVQRMPGFLGVNGYTSADGDEVGMIRFASLEALRAWREHPEYVATQLRGKTEFYAAYRVEVCEVVRAYDFRHEPAQGLVGSA